METLATRLKWLSRMQPPGSNEQRIMLEAARELEYEEILETNPEESIVVEFSPELTSSDVVAYMKEHDIKLLPWQLARLGE
jgi:hypothetical protein